MLYHEYDDIRLLKKSERGEVYRKLLPVSCQNLPQIMKVGETDNRTALLEEYVQGDNLGEILEGSLLTTDEARQILGTTGFAVPEQYGLSQSDARADIYEVGVLLNVMLTGEHPSRKLVSGRTEHGSCDCSFTDNTVGLKFNTKSSYGSSPNYLNNTFTGNGTAVCIDSLPGDEILDFAGSTFSGNDTDIENKADHPIDTAKAIFE